MKGAIGNLYRYIILLIPCLKNSFLKLVNGKEARKIITRTYLRRTF